MSNGMRKKENQSGQPSYLEENVQKLLDQSEPILIMPEKEKVRILKALKASKIRHNAAQSRTRRKISGGSGINARDMISRFWPYLTSAVAAVLIILLTLVWPSASGGGIAWAEVQLRINEACTVKAFQIMEEISESGESHISVCQYYMKDPGKRRIEYFRVPKGNEVPEYKEDLPLERILINVREGDSFSQSLLLPEIKVAQRTRTILLDHETRDRSEYATNPVAMWMEGLKSVSSDATRRIGERDIDGTLSVGFEISYENLNVDPNLDNLSGFVRVWADIKKAVPVKVETEFRDTKGNLIRINYVNIIWNCNLPEELFDINLLNGWTIMDQGYEKRRFEHTSLKPNIILRVGTIDGESLITEQDILVVPSVEATRDLGVDGSDDIKITFALKPEAAKRMESYTSKHIGDRLSINFNEEIRFEQVIDQPIIGGLILDISSLGISLAQFEQDYLISFE